MERSNVTYQCFNETYGWATFCFNYDTFEWTAKGAETFAGTYIIYNSDSNSITLRLTNHIVGRIQGEGPYDVEFQIISASQEYTLYQRHLDPCDRD